MVEFTTPTAWASQAVMTSMSAASLLLMACFQGLRARLGALHEHVSLLAEAFTGCALHTARDEADAYERQANQEIASHGLGPMRSRTMTMEGCWALAQQLEFAFDITPASIIPAFHIVIRTKSKALE
eukprot:1747445-Amphidinium_carterae.1